MREKDLDIAGEEREEELDIEEIVGLLQEVEGLELAFLYDPETGEGEMLIDNRKEELH